MSTEKNNKDFSQHRKQMVQLDLKARGINDKNLIEVMANLPREQFVSTKYLSQSYQDGPLPIGCGQTISQPFIVALMTQLLKVDKNCNVLEIGTGSGYQTAILAKLSKKVFTIERFSQLSESAQAVLGRLRIDNIEYFIADGSGGWPTKKTFDRIMITAAVPQVPQPMIEQLNENGILVAPVDPGWVQNLNVYRKKRGKMICKSICDVRFVRLIGKYGFTE